MKKLHENTVPYKRTKKLSTILIAAIIVVALLTGAALAVAGFTVYENPAAMINAFFGENGTVESEGIIEYGEDGKLRVNLPGWERVSVDESLADELIANYISAETAAVSWGGYTLAVEANLYDPVTKSGLLYYTIENPNGVSGYGVEVNGMLGWQNEAENIRIYSDKAGETYIDEAMSSDTKLYLCEYYVNWDNSDLMTELNLFLCQQIEGGEPNYAGGPPMLINETKETVTLTLDSSREIPTLRLSDGSVLISPIGIRVYDDILGFDIESYIHRIVLCYSDGSEYTLVDAEAFIDNSMYALGQYGQSENISESAVPEHGNNAPEPTPQSVSADAATNHHTTYLFNRLVDINSLSEIVLDDIVIKVK